MPLRAFFALVLCLPSLASAQAGVDKKFDMDELGKGAGAYLFVIESVRVFRQTECGYAFNNNVRLWDEVLETDILPAFPPNLRTGVASEFNKSRPDVARTAEQSVPTMLTIARKDLDPKTGCGVGAGMLLDMRARTFRDWNQIRSQYGWKPQ